MANPSTFFISFQEMRVDIVENGNDLKEALAYFENEFCISQQDQSYLENSVKRFHLSLLEKTKSTFRSMLMSMRLW